MTTSQVSNGKKIPKLRFSDLKDAWKEMELGQMIQLEPRPVSKPENAYTAIGIRSHFKGTFQKPNSDPSKIAMDTLYAVQAKDLIVNITFAWEGAVAIATKEDEGGLVSHRFPTYVFNTDITTPEYFQHIFPNDKTKYELTNISPGGAGRNRVLNKKDFLKLKFNLPTLPEQQKIANFLGAIDNWIENLRQQKEKLEAYKKGMMQQIFSQKIRFKDENGKEFPEWEEKRLGEVCDKPFYGMNASAKNYDGKNIYLRITDIDESTNKLKTKNLTTPDAELEDTYKLKEGDLLFARTGASVGKTYLYKKDDGTVYFAGYLIKFAVSKAIPFFIYLITLQESYISWVATVSMRSGQPGVNAKEYASFVFFLPSKLEQQKIVNCFTAIFASIEAKQKKIENAELWKRGLLQQLFV